MYPCNIESDTAYVVFLFPGIVTTSINAHNSRVQHLLQQLQVTLQKHSEPIYITHISSHYSLPGPMILENELADLLVMPMITSPVKEHNTLHTNVLCTSPLCTSSSSRYIASH